MERKCVAPRGCRPQRSQSNVDISELSKGQLYELLAEVKRALYPEARIEDGLLHCAQCGERAVPYLIEDGYSVTHNLEKIGTSMILARGWDGSSKQVSEEGENLMLQCGVCTEWHRIPESIEVEWT